MTYLQGECPHRRAEEGFVDSTSVECLFSITPLPGLSGVGFSGDSVNGESCFFDESLKPGPYTRPLSGSTYE
jgi:hypothetical protein